MKQYLGAWLMLGCPLVWASTPSMFYGTSPSGVEYHLNMDGAQDNDGLWRPRIYIQRHDDTSENPQLPSNCVVTVAQDGGFNAMDCSRHAKSPFNHTYYVLDPEQSTKAAHPVLRCKLDCTAQIPTFITYYENEE